MTQYSNETLARLIKKIPKTHILVFKKVFDNYLEMYVLKLKTAEDNEFYRIQGAIQAIELIKSQLDTVKNIKLNN